MAEYLAVSDWYYSEWAEPRRRSDL